MMTTEDDWIYRNNPSNKIDKVSRKSSSSAGSEKMERVGGRWGKMEGHCSTGQSPQWAVVPMEREEYTHTHTHTPDVL